MSLICRKGVGDLGLLQLIHSDYSQKDYVLLPWHANYGSGNGSRHIHPVYHFWFALEGGGAMERDGYVLPFAAGDMLIINPNELHVIRADEKAGLLFYALSFYLLPLENLARLGGPEIFRGSVDLGLLDTLAETASLEQLFDLQLFQGRPKVEAPPKLCASLHHLIQIYDQRFSALNPEFKRSWLNPQTRDKIEFVKLATFFMIELVDLFTREAERDSAEAKPDPLLSRLYNYLDSLVFDQYDHRALSRHMNYNPVYLATYFGKKTGMSPRAYVDRQKIRQACIELDETNRSVEDIAARLRYSSTAHFCANFKKVMGVTPRQYRTIFLQ